MVSFYTFNIVLIGNHSYKKSEQNLVKTQYFIIIPCYNRLNKNDIAIDIIASTFNNRKCQNEQFKGQ